MKKIIGRTDKYTRKIIDRAGEIRKISRSGTENEKIESITPKKLRDLIDMYDSKFIRCDKNGECEFLMGDYRQDLIEFKTDPSVLDEIPENYFKDIRKEIDKNNPEEVFNLFDIEVHRFIDEQSNIPTRFGLNIYKEKATPESENKRKKLVKIRQWLWTNYNDELMNDEYSFLGKFVRPKS